MFHCRVPDIMAVMGVYIFVLLFSTVLCVNRDNFKTCDQSGFCK